jgi:hypothetical protein
VQGEILQSEPPKLLQYTFQLGKVHSNLE